MAYMPMFARVNSLPPLPESVLQLESLFAQRDPEINALVKIIESDPLLTADLLSKANAPTYGFTRQIVSVLQAVTLLGGTKIRALVLAATIQRISTSTLPLTESKLRILPESALCKAN